MKWKEIIRFDVMLGGHFFSNTGTIRTYART